jgi:hypothetical protein
LDRLMAGKPSPSAVQLVSPLGITIRRSTDELAIDDPLIAAAARYIRENACRGATVQEVLRQVPMSRTVLEQKFRRYLGHCRSIVLDLRGNQENTTILGSRGAVRRPGGGSHIVAGEQGRSVGHEVAFHNVAFLRLRVRVRRNFDAGGDADQTGLEIPREIAEQDAPLHAGDAVVFPVAELGAPDEDLRGDTPSPSGSIRRESLFRPGPGDAIEQRLFYRRDGHDLRRIPVQRADHGIVRLDFRCRASIPHGETRLKRGDFVGGKAPAANSAASSAGSKTGGSLKFIAKLSGQCWRYSFTLSACLAARFLELSSRTQYNNECTKRPGGKHARTERVRCRSVAPILSYPQRLRAPGLDRAVRQPNRLNCEIPSGMNPTKVLARIPSGRPFGRLGCSLQQTSPIFLRKLNPSASGGAEDSKHQGARRQTGRLWLGEEDNNAGNCCQR